MRAAAALAQDHLALGGRRAGAALIFAPNLVWQAQHGWMTFAFQFGRMAHGAFTLRYLAEFVGAQFGALATPLILVLAAIGMWRARRPGDDRFLLFVLVGVALLYFLQHALHDRVQGNWPCFLYPALAILAADARAGRPALAGAFRRAAGGAHASGGLCPGGMERGALAGRSGGAAAGRATSRRPSRQPGAVRARRHRPHHRL